MIRIVAGQVHTQAVCYWDAQIHTAVGLTVAPANEGY